jgi:hypothetical protein
MKQATMDKDKLISSEQLLTDIQLKIIVGIFGCGLALGLSFAAIALV